MNIIYLTTEDLGNSPMSGKVHFWAIARELQALGHFVTIVAPRFTPGEPAAARLYRIIRFWAPGKNPLGLFLFEWTLWWHIGWLVRRERPDVLLVRGGGPGWFPGLIFLGFRCLGVPVVLECNGLVWQEYAWRGKSSWLVANVWLSAWQQAFTSNHIIGVTQEIADTHRRMAGKRATRAHAIPNGTDPEDFQFSTEDRRRARQEMGIPSDSLVAGYVGAFSPWHNIRSLVDAAEMLDRRPARDLQIVLVGDGELAPWARQQQEARHIQSLQLPGAVRDRERLRRWLACFDVGLCVNIPLHGSPLKVFEYLAAGIPVIVSGFPQLLRLCRDDGIGIGMESSDPEAIVAAIEQISRDRAHWEQVGRGNRQLAKERFTWQRVAKEVEGVLQKAAGP